MAVVGRGVVEKGLAVKMYIGGSAVLGAEKVVVVAEAFNAGAVMAST